MEQQITVNVDGHKQTLTVDTRMSLLDALREKMSIHSPKKGCDHGQCGACTVLIDGRRMVSCLTFAVAKDGCDITTADGLSEGDELHSMQQAFLDHDGFQCGYCTPGQICSAIGMLDEYKSGHPSYVSDDDGAPIELDREEIRERMSGNLCRCGAYLNIVAAIESEVTA